MLLSIVLSVATPFFRNPSAVRPTNDQQLQAGTSYYVAHSLDDEEEIGKYIVDNKKGQWFSSGFIKAAIKADPKKENVKFVHLVASITSFPVDNGMGYDQSNGPFHAYKEIFNYNSPTLFRMIYIVATTAQHFGPFPLWSSLEEKHKDELRSLIHRQQSFQTEEQRAQIHLEFHKLLIQYIASGANYYKEHATDTASASATYIVDNSLGQEFASEFVLAAIAADHEKKNVKFVDSFCSEVSYPAEATIGYKRSNGPFPAYEEIFNYNPATLFRMIYVTATTQGTMAYIPLWDRLSEAELASGKKHLTKVDKDRLRDLIYRQQTFRFEEQRTQIHKEFESLLRGYISVKKSKL